MAEKELRKMNRAELIEIIYALQQNDRQIRTENEEIKRQLDDKLIRLDQSGSIAEAALSLNHIFEDAEKAAEQYLESLAFASSQAGEHAEQMLNETRAQAEQITAEAHAQEEQILQEARMQAAQTEQILKEARAQATQTTAEARAQSERMLAEARAQAEQTTEEAEAQAAQTTAEAQAQSEEILAAAQEERDRIQEECRQLLIEANRKIKKKAEKFNQEVRLILNKHPELKDELRRKVEKSDE